MTTVTESDERSDPRYWSDNPPCATGYASASSPPWTNGSPCATPWPA